MLNNTLQTCFPNDKFSCVYNVSVGTITISSTMDFRKMTDGFVKTLQGISGWYGNSNEETGRPDYNNLRSINEVLRYSTQASPGTSFETGFNDLLNVHKIYTHSSNLVIMVALGYEVRIRLLNKFMLQAVLVILLWIQ